MFIPTGDPPECRRALTEQRSIVQTPTQLRMHAQPWSIAAHLACGTRTRAAG